MIRFYFHPTPNPAKISSVPRRDRHLPYEIVPIDTGKGEQHAPAFRKINPNGKVPAIVDTDGPGGKETGCLIPLPYCFISPRRPGNCSGATRNAAGAIVLAALHRIRLGPFFGQAVHFQWVAPEGSDYARNRYRREAERHYHVVERSPGRPILHRRRQLHHRGHIAWGWIDRPRARAEGQARTARRLSEHQALVRQHKFETGSRACAWRRQRPRFQDDRRRRVPAGAVSVELSGYLKSPLAQVTASRVIRVDLPQSNPGRERRWKRHSPSNLTEFRANWRTRVPAERQATMDRHVAHLAESGISKNAKQVGDRAPAIQLRDQHGQEFDIASLLAKGPVIVNFYRGGWCPFCNLELKAYQDILPRIRDAGANLVAISPEKPDDTVTTAEKNALTFPVLSDIGQKVGKAFGLVYAFTDDLRSVYDGFKLDIPAKNGVADDWSLPLRQPTSPSIGTVRSCLLTPASTIANAPILSISCRLWNVELLQSESRKAGGDRCCRTFAVRAALELVLRNDEGRAPAPFSVAIRRGPIVRLRFGIGGSDVGVASIMATARRRKMAALCYGRGSPQRRRTMGPHVGLQIAPAAQIALVQSLTPLLTALSGVVLLHERLRSAQWGGLALGLMGVSLVVGEAAIESAARLEGLVLALVGVLGLVSGTLYFGRFCRAVPFLPAAAAQFAGAAIVFPWVRGCWKRRAQTGPVPPLPHWHGTRSWSRSAEWASTLSCSFARPLRARARQLLPYPRDSRVARMGAAWRKTWPTRLDRALDSHRRMLASKCRWTKPQPRDINPLVRTRLIAGPDKGHKPRRVINLRDSPLSAGLCCKTLVETIDEPFDRTRCMALLSNMLSQSKRVV